MFVDACSGVGGVLVAAADETSHAEARRAKPSQASQSKTIPWLIPNVPKWAKKGPRVPNLARAENWPPDHPWVNLLTLG